MPDKSLTLLEKYDIEPLQIKRGRGGYIIDTNNGAFFFQEYLYNHKKLEILEFFQKKLMPDFETDLIIRSKEQELLVTDTYDTNYILKKIVPGREFNYKSEEEIKSAFEMLGNFQNKLHEIYHTYLSQKAEDSNPYQFTRHSITETLQKHTKDCKHIQKYLLHKKNKTDFERDLLASFDTFLPQALQITEESIALYQEKEKDYINKHHPFYHGDFQYHNILFQNTNAIPINLEHMGIGSGIRDFANLFRKICEKNDWNTEIGYLMISSYIKTHPLEEWEWKELALLLSYPLKFWKIVNHYYNKRKTNIPQKNMEKLEIIKEQEKQKQILMKELF